MHHARWLKCGDPGDAAPLRHRRTAPEWAAVTGRECQDCGQVKMPKEFYWDGKRLTAKCKVCRAADQREQRRRTGPPPRFCTLCGGPLVSNAKLDVCRRTPECLRINTQRHNFRGSRRNKEFPPCAGCGGDWLRASGSEKMCPDCRETQFWCPGFKPGTGHAAPLRVHRPKSQGCRACVLLRHAFSRARERGLPFTLTPEYVESIYNETCPYLGLPLGAGVGRLVRTSPTLDRIIPAAGYVEGNVEIISHVANTMKSEALPDELVAFARAVLRRHAPGAEAVAS